ncbi:MAG: helix-turn-helix domain-containing protein [Trueperaceae bacterium]|nr:helix-turn-helix domain-containing protein [Trueperaceae bacterium]
MHLTNQPESLAHPTLPLVLTIQEFYEALEQTVGINSIRALVKAGQIKSIKVGNKHLIPRSEVTDWLQREAEASLRRYN